MSNLTKHAEYELRRAGLFNKDSDYGGMIGPAIMKMVEVFAAEGHSGHSAALTLHIFGKVANFKTLTPITSSPDEWNAIDDSVWQNRRQSSCFSNDGGRTYYDIDDKARTVVKASDPPK